MLAVFSRVIKVNFNENEKTQFFVSRSKSREFLSHLKLLRNSTEMKSIYFVILLLAVPASLELTQGEGVEGTNELVSVNLHASSSSSREFPFRLEPGKKLRPFRPVCKAP